MSTSVFLSYARGDDEAYAARLYRDLTARGFDVWFDRVAMPSRGLTFLQEIRDAINERDRLLLVVGPKAVNSEYVSSEWRHAVGYGKPVTPVLRQGDYPMVPAELKLLHIEDFRDDSQYAFHLENLARQLAERVPPMGQLIGVPALPRHLLGRPDRLRSVKDAVLADLMRPIVVTGVATCVGVHGMGGIGKSVLANLLARDSDVRRAFPDGIFWVPFGATPNVLELQRNIARVLGDLGYFKDIKQGTAKLKELLVGRKVLLVLDDVWDHRHASAFDALGPLCRGVITTRDAGLVATLGGVQHQLQLLTEAEALTLFAGDVGVTVEALPLEAHEIVRECGCLPLGIALCAGMYQRGYRWTEILERLRQAALDRIGDAYASNEQHASIWTAIKASFDVLNSGEQRRFAELAVFPSDEAVPEAAVRTLWMHCGGLDNFSCDDLLVRLSSQSLIGLELEPPTPDHPDRRRVTMHDLLHDFAGKIAGDAVTLNAHLVDAYRKVCSDGWASGPDDAYFFQRLPLHLRQAGGTGELDELLTDFRWIQAKTSATNIEAVLTDYEPVSTKAHKLLRDALRLSAHVVAEDKSQLAGQLTGRLLKVGDATVARLLADIRRFTTHSWLRPVTLNLTAPGGALVGILQADAPYVFDNYDRAFAVNAVVITVDGRYVLSGWGDTVKVWDLSRGECTATLEGHTGTLNAVAVTADGRQAVSSADDGTIRVWDLSTGRCTATLQANPDNIYGGNRIRALAVTADGRRAISGTPDNMVSVWDLVNQRCTARLAGHDGGVSAVALILDGCYAVSGCGGAEAGRWFDGPYYNTLTLWNLTNGSCVSSWQTDSPGVTVSTGTTEEWGEVSVSRCNSADVLAVAVTPDGRQAVSGEGDSVWLTGLQTGRRTRIGTHKGRVLAIAIAPDGQHAASGSEDASICVWHLPSAQCVEKLEEGYAGPIKAIAITPDGRHAISGSRDQTLKIWELFSGRSGQNPLEHASKVTDIVITSDSRAVSASCDRTLKIWDLSTGQCLATLQGHADAVDAVAVTLGGRYAVSGSSDRTLKIWDVSNRECTATLYGHNERVWAVMLTPDGQRAVSAAHDEMRVWDLSTRECTAILRHDAGRMFLGAVMLTADGRFAVSASDESFGYKLKAWDLSSGECTSILEKCSWHPIDGSMPPATLSFGGQLTMLMRASGEDENELSMERRVPAVYFASRGLSRGRTADGRLAVFGDKFGDVLRVCERRTGRKVASFTPEGRLAAWAISPDGLTVVAGESSGQLHFLRLENV